MFRPVFLRSHLRGGGRESNPPTDSHRRTGFEDQDGHQAAVASPHKITVIFPGMAEFTPGERFAELTGFVPDPGAPGIWNHLGWKRTKLEPGYVEIEWEPTTDHAFPAGEGWIVHGGMVTAILDTAMGNATWSLLNLDEVFLTADLRTEFYRPTTPGLVRAHGRVVHKTRRVAFASAELFDAGGKLLASGRATNMTIDLTNPQDQSRRSPSTPDRG